MTTIRFEESFSKNLKKFTKNNSNRANAVKKALLLFQQDSKHPSLNAEKLTGTKIWSIRIDRGNRLFFTWSADVAVFFFVGPHDSYKTLKK